MRARQSIAAHLCMLVFAVSGFFTAAGGAETLHDRILRVFDNTVITFMETIRDLKNARIVFIGEQHDRMIHHKAQLKTIRALKESGVPVAIGLEMFQARDQKVLDDWLSGKTELHEFLVAYYRNWPMPWPLYRDVFLYAKDTGIPLIGLNVPYHIVQQVAEKGFASLKPEQLRKLPGVSCTVDPAYRRFILKALGDHGKDEQSFTYFCEAQMVWDTTMAFNLSQFLKKNPEYTVVVLAGNGHAWKQGIPEQVRRSSNISSKVILPETSYPLLKRDFSTSDTDYVWQGI